LRGSGGSKVWLTDTCAHLSFTDRIIEEEIILAERERIRAEQERIRAEQERILVERQRIQDNVSMKHQLS